MIIINIQEFKTFAKEPLSEHKTIMNLMKIIYESDISDFFPINMWKNGNPILCVYNKPLGYDHYSSGNGGIKLYYRDVVVDIEKNVKIKHKTKEDLAFYISNGSQIYLPQFYKRQGRNKA